MFDTNQDDDTSQDASIEGRAEALGIRESEGTNLELLVTSRDFIEADGSTAELLAIGVRAEAGYVSGFVPVLDVVKFAMANCPALVEQAARETATAPGSCAVQLATMVKDWWQGARHKTMGGHGERNVFDEEPDFVTRAKALIGDWDEEQDAY